ncbi:hypothetical protein [Pelagibacterium limicola]|uniref:hypothetical protein n=1 Tax=Pelagibacterium limicola TaxID=2791022 RepID=UPI0018AF5E3C|nr:hypothetical protein [Pelagibacterium limicola]
MKITWFAATTFRIHIAGRIVVVDPEGAPEGIDPVELTAGAQAVVSATSSDLPVFDPTAWRPHRRLRLIDDEDGDERLDLFRLGALGLFADSRDEGVLVIAEGSVEAKWGRWADNAVVVLNGPGAACIEQGMSLLDAARPKLVALAVTDGEIEAAFEALVPQLADASLIVLERGLAVEA